MGSADELLRERMETIFSRLKMNEIRGMLGAENVHRHEAEGFDRAGDGA